VAQAPVDGTVSVTRLSKQFGTVKAIDDLTFTVSPGTITGFLGPNGAGKTTTLRMLLGLVTPSAGSATIGGKRYAELDRPLRHAGAALEASSFHPGRRARDPCASCVPQRGCRRLGPTRCLARWAYPTSVGGGPRHSPSACGMRHAAATGAGRHAARRPAGADPRRAGQRPWTPRASTGCAASGAVWRDRAAPSWCRATCCRRSSRRCTMW